MSDRAASQSVIVKLISLLLALGGAAGIVIGLSTELTQLVQSWPWPSAMTALMGLFVVVFGLSTWVGIDLWRGKPRAYRWAKILLIAQIPQVSVPGFAYHFYTGLVLLLSYSRERSA
jgi:hypothetical protein